MAQNLYNHLLKTMIYVTVLGRETIFLFQMVRVNTERWM